MDICPLDNLTVCGYSVDIAKEAIMDRIEVGGKTYVAKEPLGSFPISGGDSCSECRGCAFYADELLETCINIGSCCTDEREDGRDIIWVEE